MNTYATRKDNKQPHVRKHQDDVYSEARPYSVWQGYALVIALIPVVIVLFKWIATLL